jgi:diguanylate cyclase (GGDEF)-like protein/PAS domain S-box-containing protein
MKFDRSNWKPQLGFGSAIVALLVVGAISYRASLMSAESEGWVRHTHEVLEALDNLMVEMKTVESNARGLIITGEDSYLASYHGGIARAHRDVGIFRDLTVDNPVQQRRVPALDALATQRIQQAAQAIALFQTKGLEAAAEAVRGGRGQLAMDEFEGVVDAARDEELRLLALRRAEEDRQSSLTNTLLIVGIALGALIAAGSGWSVQRDSFRRRLAEEATRESEERFRTLANNMSQLAWMTDETGSIFWYNQRWYDYTGTTVEEMAGWGWQTVHHPEHAQRVVHKFSHCFRAGEEWEDTFPLRGRDGSYRWFLSRAVPIRDANGRVLRWFGTNTDISDRKLLEEALFEERERAHVTLESIGDAVACTDISGNISFLNVVAEKMTGWSSKEATGQPMAGVLRIVDAATRATIPNPMEMAIAINRAVTLPSNCLLIRRDGVETPIEDSVAPIHDRDGQVTGAVIVFRDVSAARAMAQQMTHSARHDFLTGLPNRMLLNDRIDQALILAARHEKKAALLFLDLDGFKHINDSLGHAVGDKLLQSIATRLLSCVRGSDTVSRQGGDEFVVLLSEVERSEDAAPLAARMLQSVAAAHLIDGHELHVSTSIGVSVYPEDGVDAVTLIKNADTAMYQAKENGRRSFKFFKPAMNARAVERQSTEVDLRRALERREFELLYQSKIHLDTGAITGAEALIRWMHPIRGLVAPAEFIPIAEDCGLIVPIGNWALRTACEQARAWLDAGLPKISMAVNISATEFHAGGFLQNLFGILEDAGLNPRSLELELAEGVLMQHAESAQTVLEALRARGVRLAIDDFGTGYSSLSYLRKFRVDSLKIDRSFIKEVATGSEDASIVSAMIGIARSLGLRVVAEGVETLEEYNFLRAHQCDEAQGFYFSPPLPPAQFAKLLENERLDANLASLANPVVCSAA